MKQQSIVLSMLLIVHSFNLFAQPRSKEAYDGLFGRQRTPSSASQPSFRPAAPSTHSNRNEINIYAVVVGVGQYSAMPKLRYTGNDARFFYDHLISPRGGSIPRGQITLLLEADATHWSISQALRQMAQRADENDVVIFYFSGHGLTNSFLPIDFNGYSNQLAHDDVFKILQSSRAKHKLCIADACNSGALDYNNGLVVKGPSALPGRQLYREYANAQSGIALLMSSSAGEDSHEDSKLRQGVFTHFLLRAMSGSADFNQDNVVSIKELFHYVFRNVNEYTGGAQSPWLSGDYDDNMPLAIGLP